MKVTKGRPQHKNQSMHKNLIKKTITLSQLQKSIYAN